MYGPLLLAYCNARFPATKKEPAKHHFYVAHPSLEANVTTTGTTSSVSLAWGAVTGATSYKVYRGTAAGLESVFYTTTTNSFTDTGAASTVGTVPTVNTTATATPGFTITFSDVTSDAGTRYQTATHNMTRCFCSVAHKNPRAPAGEPVPTLAGRDGPPVEMP